MLKEGLEGPVDNLKAFHVVILLKIIPLKFKSVPTVGEGDQELEKRLDQEGLT
jgi:hypothetical protein